MCRALKNNEETKDIPIIVLTARTGMEDRQRVAELGAESYLSLIHIFFFGHNYFVKCYYGIINITFI